MSLVGSFMKAVIPAAGLGTRFLPHTKAQPKEMLPVLDKPAIQYVVEEAVNSGIKDVLIVTGRGKRTIEDHFDRNIELESYLRKRGKNEELAQMQRVGDLAEIMYVRQKEPLGLGHAISCAEKYVGDEPFAVLLGDDICIDDEPCTKQLIDIFKKKNTTVIAIQEVPHNKVSSYGIVTVKSIEENLYELVDIEEKPSQLKAKSNLATIGRYVFTKDIFPILKTVKSGIGGEIQLTDAIKGLLKSNSVLALNYQGRRFDIGDLRSWLKANIELAMEKPEIKEELADTLKNRLFQDLARHD